MIKHFRRVFYIIGIWGLSSFCSNAKTHIELWHSLSENIPFWHKLETDFNQLNEDYILKTLHLNHEEMKQAIIKTRFGERYPDVVFMPSDWLGFHSVMHFSAVDLELIHNAVPKTAISDSYFDDQLRGIPFAQGNHLIMMYNKKLTNKKLDSWHDLFILKDKLMPKNIMPLGLNFHEMYWFMPFISAYGGVLDKDDNVALDNQSIVKALQFYRRLSDYKVTSVNCTYACVSRDFYASKVAYAINGAWAYRDAKNALGDDLGLQAIPAIEGISVQSMRANFVLSFPNNSLQGLKREALIAFTKFVQQEKYQKLLYQLSGTFPINQHVINGLMAKNESDFSLLYNLFLQSKTMPASTSFAALWSGMYKGFYLYMSDHLNAESAAHYMQQRVEREQRVLQDALKDD